VNDVGDAEVTLGTVAAADPSIERSQLRVLEPRGRVRSVLAAHPTCAYVLRRFVLYLVTLWAAISATFFFFRLIPGDPIRVFLQNLQQNHLYGQTAGEEVIKQYSSQFGLDGNVFEQYWRFMQRLVLHGDFGPSLLNYPKSAQGVIASSLPWTIGLLVIATALAWILGTVLGALAGWRRDGKVAAAITYVSLSLSHIPYYFVALIMIYLFSYKLGVFPSSYAYGVDVAPGFTFGFARSVIEHGMLPALSIVIVVAAECLLGMRQQMITVLGDDYLMLAQAKGLHPYRILRRYAMPNCYLPQVTRLVISLGVVFGGNVLVEQVFTYPGVGHLLVQASQQLDLNVMMGVTDLGVFTVLTATFVMDLVLPLLDPRIAYSRRSVAG
jgi:peptide/nickel transport system permease protein